MAKPLKVIVVGGVAGGASAAARLRRLDEHAEIILFERGDAISYANCGLPYYIGDTIKSEARLYVQTPAGMAGRFNIDVRVNSEVEAIDPQNKTVAVHDLKTEERYTESYDRLILSPGAKPFIPPVAGADLPQVFTLRNVNDTKAIRQIIDRGEVKEAVVVGGGFIGVEMAENLRKRGIAVTVVEGSPQVLGPLDEEMAILIQNHMKMNGVKIILNTVLTGITKGEGKKLQLELNDGTHLDADMALLCIGVRPEQELAQKAGLKIGERGGIAVNEYQQTSDPSIYAVGDAAETFHMTSKNKMLLALAGPANRQGRLAADNAAGKGIPFKGVIGTSILKVFQVAAASTGYNEKQLIREKIAYEKIYIHPLSHAGYYPNSGQMTLKLLFSPTTRAVLGAQIVGTDGVDKRIDVIATAVQLGGTVDQLSQLELAYAPPFASAKDPVNMAGFVAGNVLDGMSNILHWHDVDGLNREEWVIVDVRTPAEYEMGHIEGAVLLPLDNMRNYLAEIPKDKNILLYCKVGLRGYYGERILGQHGFDRVYNLSGGYQLYSSVQKEPAVAKSDAARPVKGVSADGSQDIPG